MKVRLLTKKILLTLSLLLIGGLSGGLPAFSVTPKGALIEKIIGLKALVNAQYNNLSDSQVDELDRLVDDAVRIVSGGVGGGIGNARVKIKTSCSFYSGDGRYYLYVDTVSVSTGEKTGSEYFAMLDPDTCAKFEQKIAEKAMNARSGTEFFACHWHDGSARSYLYSGMLIDKGEIKWTREGAYGYDDCNRVALSK